MARRRMDVSGRLAVAALLVLAAAGARAQTWYEEDGEPAFLIGAVGAAGAFDEEFPPLFRLEVRPAQKLWAIRPFLGVEATTERTTYLYWGLAGDVYFGRRLVLTPNLAMGWFNDQDGLDLGYGLQFRSGFELAYRFDDRSRLGVTFHHISNANLGEKNPGTETVTVQYALPLWRLFGD